MYQVKDFYIPIKNCIYVYVRKCFFLIDTFLNTGGCYAKKTHNAFETLQINEKHIILFLYVSRKS